MGKSFNQKLKLLYIMQMLKENTDENHAMSANDIISALAKQGISAERKSIYDDIERLKLFGCDILSRRSEPKGYYLASRDFEIAELKLLVDAVQSSKFITEKKSNQLIHKIEQLASRHEAQTLQRQVVVSNRIKTMNESIYYNIDKLHSAISSDVKITFKYCSWTLAKKLEPKKDGANYTVSPYILVWDDENYYLIAFDHDAGEIRHYRVDKMDSLVQTDLPREGKQLFDDRFDAAAYSRKVFGMFSGEEKTVKLKCLNRFIGVMLDRFGSSLRLFPADNEHFYLDVDVVVSPQFFSWVFSLEGDVRIVNPPEVCEAFEKQIHKFID
jgi:predicted DNA-binding transcriptional regulator YafY